MLDRFSKMLSKSLPKLLLLIISILVFSAAVSAFNYTCIDTAINPQNVIIQAYSCYDTNTLLTNLPDPTSGKSLIQCTQVINPTARIDLGDGNCIYAPTTPNYPNVKVDMTLKKAYIDCSGTPVYAGDHSNKNCIVSTTQTILPSVYYFTNFTVNAGVTLTVASLSIGTGGGGGGGGAGLGGGAGGGIGGGTGGALLMNGHDLITNRYNPNVNAAMQSGYSGFAGGMLMIQASTTRLNGAIIASGSGGNAGTLYIGTCGPDPPDGYGQGGGGGGGGGYIIIKSNVFLYTNTASIQANGGAGGPWGRGYCNGQSGGCGNSGHGGGGGGGNSGLVSLQIRNDSDNVCNKIMKVDKFVQMNGGSGGWIGGCEGQTCPLECVVPELTNNGWPYAGSSYTATDYCIPFSTKETQYQDPYIACNDGIDNDANGQIDMNDSDCYNASATAQGWDSIIHPYFNTTKWFNASSVNGSDLTCGDDFGSCVMKYKTCQDFGNDITDCQSAGCTVAGSCGGETTTTSCSNFAITDPYNCLLGCAANAPLGCTPTDTQQVCYGGPTGNDPNGYMTRCDGTILCNQYNSQTSCETTGCTWTPASACTGIITNNTCAGLTKTSCMLNPACGLSTGFGNDYGYITPDFQNMCYNKNSYLLNPTDEWQWLSSYIDNGGLIYTLKNGQANDEQVDTVSNGDQWYYSNADPSVTGGLKGNPIKEYSTFPIAPIYTTDKINCTFFMNFVHPSADPANKYIDNLSTGCKPSSNVPCCVKGNTFLLSTGDLSTCTCYPGTTITGHTPCDIYKADVAAGNDNYPKLAVFCGDASIAFSSTGQLVGKDAMKASPLNKYYDPDKACSDQKDFTGKVLGINCAALTPAESCLNGIPTYAADTNGKPTCCFGDNPTCVLQDPKCPYGTKFNLTVSTCNGAIYPTGSGVEYCCLGTLAAHPLLTANFFGAAANNQSFIAYKEDGNSVLGECCYENCVNNMLIDGTYADEASNQGRVVSSGNTFHSLSTFDTFGNQQLLDTSYQITVTGTGTAEIPIDRPINLSHFSYLEFDIKYDYEFGLRNISIETSGSTVDYGTLISHLTNGHIANSPRHAVIKLNPYQENEQIRLIKIDVANTLAVPETVLKVDNIRLTPAGDDLQNNSKSYYCAGGFSAWIPDLDPNLTRYPYTLGTAENIFYTDFDKGFGRYKEACDDQAAFYWTGHQCCGNNKYPDNFGEFFADILGGCFNSTFVTVNQSMSDALGNNEFLNKKSFDSLSVKDIMYNDTRFYGCEVPAGKYGWLKTSFDGSLLAYQGTIQGTNLALQNVKSQCAVVGSYYCYNNAWHSYMPGYNGPLAQALFKDAPPGGDLVFNGGFNG